VCAAILVTNEHPGCDKDKAQNGMAAAGWCITLFIYIQELAIWSSALWTGKRSG
jgi:hypothetical protein